MDVTYFEIRNGIDSNIGQVKLKIEFINEVYKTKESVLLQVDEFDTLNNILANIDLDEAEKKTYRDKIDDLNGILVSLNSDFVSLNPFEKNKNFGNLSTIIEEKNQHKKKNIK
jgi:hypothetical protein